ncbi:CDP-alcohol phosphatidyltransferase family protein [Saccharopolyspora spinosa]|uniref:CDP-alcohol phosphatidyltransferase family protein n=1 Tax=Saccharopolyspora spinosa TaxID=60894 RepID=UPI000237A3F1
MVQDAERTTENTTSGDGGMNAGPAGQEPAAGRPDPGIARIREAAAGVWADPWWTLPNLLSAIRLAGVPVFLWLLLGPKADLLALLVLVISGITDWLDGKLARWLNQYSRIGELLDPAADRLYIVATLVAFVLRDVVPWWVAAALVIRDVVLTLCLPVLRWHGYEPPDVHYLGKAATFCLMYAFPLLLLVQEDFPLSDVVRPIAYAFTCWGGALYLWAGILYLGQVVAAVHQARAKPV